MLRKFLNCLFLLFTPWISVWAQEQQQHVFSIYFPSNGDQLTAVSKTFIRQQLIDIGSGNIREIRLKGHTDADADDTFNIRLSERRALNARSYFLTQGVPERMIQIEVFGEKDPVSELKNLNRRVEITIVYDYGAALTEMKGRKFYVKGLVTNYNTRLPMACSYVIEDQKLNVFQSTRSNGKFGFMAKPGKTITLTFSKEGFLNATYALTDAQFKTVKGDTLFLDIRLKPVEVIEKLVFEKIYFFSDSDSLRPESKPELEKLLKILKSDKSLFVEIQGHMNCPVSRPMTIYQKRYNHELSHKRAKAVFRYLVKNQIPPGQLTFKGMSNFNMIYPEPKNDAEADKNKRVEVWKLKVIQHE